MKTFKRTINEVTKQYRIDQMQVTSEAISLNTLMTNIIRETIRAKAALAAM